MAREIDSKTPRRSKAQALFYMDVDVITELKHRAVDLKKSYSQLAEVLIIAGLRNDNLQPK
jgi:hypothetical protein